MGRSVTANHWGIGVVSVTDGTVTNVARHEKDPDPSPLNDNIARSLHGSARVRRPTFRRGWLDGKPGHPRYERGKDEFVELDWDEALERIANEVKRVRSRFGNQSIFAGSYGWSSAGRFHHAQSQLKRFLNLQGGFVKSYGNYSYNAALVLMPYLVKDFRHCVAEATRWSVIEKHTNTIISFGGLPLRNTQISDGGISKHTMAGNLDACGRAGIKTYNISPLKTDAPVSLNAEWIAPVPGTDTAMMMGMAHTLISENLHDLDFIKKYTVGFEQVESHLLGKTDNTPKDADWASGISGINADRIRSLAREAAAGRTMLTLAAGLQRGDFGEQPIWMVITLAALLGQIGLPGGGFTVGYAVNGNVGSMERLFRSGTIPQGNNPIDDYIPVAMISEMLLKPGEEYDYNGGKRLFPDIKLVWWAGGNPFHHHQDLNRLRDAFQKPETIIVNEINWTATARHADIVLPVASTLERTDFGAGRSDNGLVPMPAAIEPQHESRSEFDIYTQLSQLLGNGDEFTDGKTADEWLCDLWDQTRSEGKRAGVELPDWDTFVQGDALEVPDPSPEQVFLADFRAAPQTNPLPTTSGKIELYSETIASFNLTDCPGQATFFQPRDLNAGLHEHYPLFLLSGQPATRLHSQFDNGAHSMAHKIKGREPVLINPDDAVKRDICDGDIVELINNRGACLAGAIVTEDIAQGCVFLWTGAWYDPDFGSPNNRDRHGNPNVLTHDYRTSSLTQSPAAHSALVEVRKFKGELPDITVFEQPKIAPRR